MEFFFAVLVLIALCVFGLCFNIIFRKDGKFPETEIENNREMRKRGIKCAKEEEMKIWARKTRTASPYPATKGDAEVAVQERLATSIYSVPERDVQLSPRGGILT